ncbi:LytTR family transcriptional regulator, partial [Lactobacillus taiwanensis]
TQVHQKSSFNDNFVNFFLTNGNSNSINSYVE